MNLAVSMGEMWINFGLGLLQGLIIAGITALAAFIFTKKYYPQLKFSRQMKKYGFSDKVTVTSMTDREKYDVFYHAQRIRIMYVSGFHFFSMQGTRKMIETALRRGAEICLLCAGMDEQFLTDIELLENEADLRPSDKKIIFEIKEIKERYKAEKNFKIKHFSTEYRLPIILADYDFDEQSQTYSKTKAWVNITLPPYKSKKSIVLRGMVKNLVGREGYCFTNNFKEDELNFVEMMDVHFESVWLHAKDDLENS